MHAAPDRAGVAPVNEERLGCDAGGQRPELTLRALAAGLVVGSLIGASNVAIGLKVGFTFGSSVTAAVLSFALFRTLAPLLARPYSSAETVITATAGSAAGSMASAAGIVSFIPALAMTGVTLSYWQLVGWSLGTAFLGVLFAVPLRRQMLVVEKLPYPSGTATAQTIAAMYASGADAAGKARVLAGAALAAVALRLLFSIEPLGLSAYELLSLDTLGLGSAAVLGVGLAGLRVGVSLQPMLAGAGILVGPRIGWSLLLGAAAAWVVAAPAAVHFGWASPQAGLFAAARGWVLWPGVALMVVSGLVSLILQHRTIRQTLAALVHGAPATGAPEETGAAMPRRWWLAGLTAAVLATMTLAWFVFRIPPWMALLAVTLSFLMAAIAVRAAGETDFNPAGPMSKVTQIVYGGIAPGSMSTNLMAAGITMAGAAQAGDLMHDLKTGLLLGSSVRRQVVAQLCGVVAGVLTVAGVYELLAATERIPGDTFGAPSVLSWHAVAQLLAQGLSALPAGSAVAVGVASSVAVVLTLLARVRRLGRFVPSPTAMGIACIIPPAYALTMWGAAVAASAVGRRRPGATAGFAAPLASGLIAGDGLTFVAIALLKLAGVSWV